MKKSIQEIHEMTPLQILQKESQGKIKGGAHITKLCGSVIVDISGAGGG